jgi:hypothetical protein
VSGVKQDTIRKAVDKFIAVSSPVLCVGTTNERSVWKPFLSK